MQIDYLRSSLLEMLSEVSENFSICIHSSNGNITINAENQKKAASIVKLFILVEAFRQKEKGNLSFDDTVSIDKKRMVGGSGIITNLTESHVYSYRNLIELMIIVSDNTASNVLLDKLGINEINNLANQIGCEQTIITRKFMDYHAASKGFENYTSASDVCKLLQLLPKKNNILSDNSREQILDILAKQQFNHKLPSYFPEGTTFYHKTGEITGAEHDAGIFKNKQEMIPIAVLSDGWEENGRAQRYLAEIGRLIYKYAQ
ncbi:serine hydrolase [Oceanobacillus halophilus]|nr:serine hydrolase [Oceanobacillus halophilus]